MSRRPPKSDPEHKPHQEWLGFHQLDSLLVGVRSWNAQASQLNPYHAATAKTRDTVNQPW